MDLDNLHSIWKVPVYLPYLKPALTDEMVKAAEAKIGYKLPKEFIEVLKIQNGGYIRYVLSGTPHSQIAGIGEAFPSFTEFEWLLEYEDAVGYELKGLFPFDGDGHWNLCLDYRKNSDHPEITYIDTESDYEKKIADNFKEYLGLLALETDHHYVLRTEMLLEDAIRKIAGLTGVKFGEPDRFAQGYPVYAAPLPDGRIWVRANKVPAGFVRPGEERYDELKHWMDRLSLSYPELSETDLLITVASDTQERTFIEILKKEGLTIACLDIFLDESTNL